MASSRSILIYVRSDLTKEFIEIRTKRCRTTLDIKHSVFEKKEIPVSDKHLIYRNRVLSDESTLDEIGLVNGSVLRLLPKDSPDADFSNCFHIFVETHTGDEPIRIRVRPQCTSLAIKKYLYTLKRVPMLRQNLLYKYQEFPDSKTVEEMGMVDGSSLQLVLKMLSGPKGKSKVPGVDSDFIAYIHSIEIARQGEIVIDREINDFFTVTCPYRKVHRVLTKLVLSTLEINEKIVFDKEDHVKGSYIRVYYSTDSKELYDEELSSRRAAIEEERRKKGEQQD